jgi:sulfite exporter TauE/SafE
MCGGLVSSFFMKLGAKGPWPYLAYHGARVGIYGAVGVIAATIGAVLVSTGQIGLWQGVLQIIAGIIVILLGLDLLGVSPVRNRLGFAPIAWLRKQFTLAVQRAGRRAYRRCHQRPDALFDDHGDGCQGNDGAIGR